MHGWLSRGALTLSILGCSGTQTGAPVEAAKQPSTTTVRRAEPPPSFADRGYGRLVAARAGLALEVPERASWQPLKSRIWDKWQHSATGGELELYRWPAERLARPESCEAAARVRRPDLPKFVEEQIVDQRELRVPPGFLTQVSVGVVEISANEIEGHVLAFGAAVQRCVALHFVTRVAGVGPAANIAEETARRLNLVVERVLPSLTDGSVEDRVKPVEFGSP